MTKRRKYSKESKLDAVSLVLEQGNSQAEAARNLGINSNMLSRWINSFKTTHRAERRFQAMAANHLNRKR